MSILTRLFHLILFGSIVALGLKILSPTIVFAEPLSTKLQNRIGECLKLSVTNQYSDSRSLNWQVGICKAQIALKEAYHLHQKICDHGMGEKECYHFFATIYNDSSLQKQLVEAFKQCEPFSGSARYVSLCFAEHALFPSSPLICRHAPLPLICYQKFAVYNASTTACSYLPGNERLNCSLGAFSSTTGSHGVRIRDCQKIADAKEGDDCLFSLATEVADLHICALSEDPSRCFTRYASHKMDPKLCTFSYNPRLCEAAVLINEGKAEGPEGISMCVPSTGEFDEKCLLNLVVSKKEPLFCKLLYKNANCLSEAVLVTGNTDLCRNTAWSDDCFFKSAEKLGKPSLCFEQKNSYSIKQCIKEFPLSRALLSIYIFFRGRFCN